MIFPAGTINLKRLYSYYPDLKMVHDSLAVADQDRGYPVTYVLDIKPKVEGDFANSLDLLMRKYDITDEYWPDIIFICQVTISQLYYETEANPETDNAIKFLMEYQLMVEAETKPEKDPFMIQVKKKNSNGGVNLHYHGSAPLIMKTIYKAFKTSFANPTLSLALEDYPNIPSSIILKEMLSDHKLKKLATKSVQETAEILTNYFERFLPNQVHSRRKNLLIFELLWLFDILKYAGTIVKKDMTSTRTRTYEPTYALPYRETKCTEIVKELLKKELS